MRPSIRQGILLLLTLAAYAPLVSAQAPTLDNYRTNRLFHDPEHEETYQACRWLVARYKGILQGFGQGFYEDSQYLANQECLNNDAIEAIDNLLEGFNHGVNVID